MIDNFDIPGMIDHTLLKPEATIKDIKKLCLEAKDNKFASVCVNPCYVAAAASELEDTNVKVCTVIGFPLGANSTNIKAEEAVEAVRNGAKEVDMVINVGMLKSGNNQYVKDDIKAVVEAVKEKAIVKVIIETCLLTDDEKINACRIAKEAGADYVKTSTGFGKCGAKPEDVRLMRNTVGNNMGVKASGGIHSLEDARIMIENGATRLGTSSSMNIIKEME